MSLKLMKGLQPFTQLGVMSAGKAKSIVDEFIKGNDEPLNDFILNPDMPMQYITLIDNLTSLIQRRNQE